MAWRYACNIPTYINGKDEKGDPVVLYRVNVFFQQQNVDRGATNEEGAAAQSTDSAPFFVLRRYSQFRHLHDQLKAISPAIMAARGMAPPPKHPLVLGDKRDALERRRSELERWLWRLVATPEVAGRSALKAFLELDKALARAQRRQKLEHQQQQRLLLEGGPDLLRGSSVSGIAPPSEYGTSLVARHPHLAAYPGGAGGASVRGDDSASDASGPSGAATTVDMPSSLLPGAATAAATAAAAGGSAAILSLRYAVPDPRGPASGRGEQEQHESSMYGMGGGGGDRGATARVVGAEIGAVNNASTGAAQAARLGIHLQSRADVRRLVDLLVQRLEAACSDAASAATEAALLREANRAMAERLGELELLVAERRQAGGGEFTEDEGQAAAAADAAVRNLLAESEAARAALEQRVAQLDENLASRSAAHAQQVTQLQSQLTEARTDNAELLQRLQEWDVGSTCSGTAAAQQRAEELQLVLDEHEKRLAEQQPQLEEQQRLTEQQQRRLEELQQRLEEHNLRSRGEAEATETLRKQLRQLEEQFGAVEARADELQERLREREQQLTLERQCREQMEQATKVPPLGPPLEEQHRQMAQAQALVERARADNALLAQEVQRLRAAAVTEREAHKAALAVQAQASTQLVTRVRDLEAQLVAMVSAAAPPPTTPPLAVASPTQDLLL